MRRISDDQLAGEQPHRSWLPEQARMSAKASTPFGCLNLLGSITDNQYEAGQRYMVIVARYRSSIETPREGYSGSGKGYPCTGSIRCEDCECDRRKERHERALKAMPDERSQRAVAHAIQGMAELQEIDHLKRGLSALVLHFGI